MEYHCMSIPNYHQESPEEAYSYGSQADHHEYFPFVDDAHYFDIDISSPYSPTDSTGTSSSISDDQDISEDEFELDLSIFSANTPNPNHCISYADNLFYQGQLLPLQLNPRALEYDVGIKALPSSNLPAGVKTQFPKLLKTATKLKISFLGFGKSAKLGMDLKSPRAENAGMESFVPKKNRLFTVKLNVVEVPLVSLLPRDNIKGTKRDNDNRVQKKSEDSDDGEGKSCKSMDKDKKKSEDSDDGEGNSCKSMDKDKKRAKEIVQKYVKKIKPLYVKITQRCNEKIRFGDLEKLGVRNGVKNGRCKDLERSEKQISFSYFSCNLKMVYKHFGKGKQSPSDIQQKLPSESTLMELQSAIQGAIAHCKQSNYIH